MSQEPEILAIDIEPPTRGMQAAFEASDLEFTDARGSRIVSKCIRDNRDVNCHQAGSGSGYG